MSGGETTASRSGDATRTLCVLPFMHLSVFPDGTCRLCCMAAKSIEDASGTFMTLPQPSVEEIWTSPYMQAVRRDMVDGSAVADCVACYHTEASGGDSYRLASNRRWMPHFGMNGPATLENFASACLPTPSPVSLQLIPGNVCNLACRMCSPAFSSRISADPLHASWSDKLQLGQGPVDRRDGQMSVVPRLARGIHAEGLHRSEIYENEPLQWTDGAARAIIDPPSGMQFDELHLATWNILSPDHGMTVRINDRTVYDGSSGLDDVPAVFDLKWLPSASRLVVEIDSDVLRPSGDPRTLGVPIRNLTAVLDGDLVSPHRSCWHDDFAWSQCNLFSDPESLRAIYFTGGEPMLMKYVATCLAHLDETGAAPHITVEMNSNLTVLNDRLLKILLRFSGVHISASIDGFGALNEYIRFPSNWSSVRENVRTVKAMRSSTIYISSITIVQSYNVLQLGELLRWFEDQDLDYTMELATDPWILNVAFLPRPVKVLAADRLRTFALTCRPEKRAHVLSIADMIESSIDHATAGGVSTFRRFTHELDASRRQSFRDVCAELDDMLSDYVAQH